MRAYRPPHTDDVTRATHASDPDSLRYMAGPWVTVLGGRRSVTLTAVVQGSTLLRSNHGKPITLQRASAPQQLLYLADLLRRVHDLGTEVAEKGITVTPRGDEDVVVRCNGGSVWVPSNSPVHVVVPAAMVALLAYDLGWLGAHASDNVRHPSAVGVALHALLDAEGEARTARKLAETGSTASFGAALSSRRQRVAMT